MDELSYQDDLLAAPNSFVHDRTQNTLFLLNQSFQSFDLAASKEIGVPGPSNLGVFPWAQRHTSPLRQAADVEDYHGPFNDSFEHGILDFHSNDADSVDDNLSD